MSVLGGGGDGKTIGIAVGVTLGVLIIIAVVVIILLLLYKQRFELFALRTVELKLYFYVRLLTDFSTN